MFFQRGFETVFCKHGHLTFGFHLHISIEVHFNSKPYLALIYWNMCMSLKTTRQLQHKHLSFQKITLCQNAPEQNLLPWFEVEAAAATVVREQAFLERWQLGCQTLMLNYTMPVCYRRDVISNYSYIIIYRAAKVLSERQDKGLGVCTGSIDAGGFPSSEVKSIFSLVI